MSTAPDRSPQERHDRLRNRFLAAILVLLLIFALKASAPVTMPLAVALFVIILAWPLQHRLERVLPRWAAFTLTIAAMLALLAAFVGALSYSLDVVADKAPEYGTRLRVMADQALAWARDHHLPVPEDVGDRLSGSSLGTLQQLVRSLFDFLGGVVIVAALVILGLLEVRDYRDKLHQRFGGTVNARLLDVAESVAAQFRRFVEVRTLTSAMTAALTWLYCWLAGLDFAFAWALSAFFLNYIPTLGSVVSVALIALFAGLQFQSFLWAIATAIILAAVEITIGSFIDPRMQGRYLAISPFIVLLSIVFWGWVWGIPGALIAVPLTVTLIVSAREFDRTQWLAALLTEADPSPREED